MEEAEIRPSYISRQELSDAEKSASASVEPENLNAEDQSLTGRNRRESNSDALRRRERNLRSDSSIQGSQSKNFRNSVKGKKSSSNKKGKGKGFFKKAGPIGAITGILFGGGLFFYATQSMLAPHLSALYTQATDLQFTSYNMRNTRIMSYMIDGGGQVKISNFTKKYTVFTPYMQKRLTNNGIEVGHLNSSGGFESGQAIIGNKTVLKYGDKIIDANSFQNEFATNANFREAYYNAKRGRIAGFFDKSSESFYKNKGATRDIFDQYKSTGDEEADMENFKETVSDRVTGTDGSINTVRAETDEESGEDTIKENGEDINTRNVDGATPESKARAMVNNIAGKVSTVGVPVCSALRIANLAAVAVSAYQIYQSIAYFLSFMEPISKMMAGEGDTSGINETLNFMTQQTTSTVEYVDEDGKSTTKTLTGSMVESSGAKLVMGNTTSSESAVQPFSFDNITKAATRIAISVGATTTVCSGVMAASAIVSLASTAIPGGKLATFVIGAIAQTIGGIVLTGVIAAIVNAIIPYVAKMFASNIFETYTGIPAGELFSQGAAAANFSLATQSSAYMPSSEESVKTQNHHTTRAIAQEAEVDRIHRSPLDVSSPNTFLGSIMAKFSYLSYSNPLLNSAANITRVAGSSLRSLIPAASALDNELTYTSQYSECHNLAGTQCDMYGYPIVSSDYSTVDIKPDDPTYLAVIEPNLEYTTGGSSSSSSSSGIAYSGKIYPGQKYNLSDAQISGLIAVVKHENGGSLEAMQTEATQMANLFEYKKKNTARTADNFVDYVVNGGWYAAGKYYSTSNRSYTQAEFNAMKDIWVNGNRIMPAQVVEHDCIKCGNSYDIVWAKNDGVSFNVDDRSKYISGKTLLHNRYGSTYVFYKFATNSTRQGDPFGYFQSNPPTETGSSSSSSSSSSSTSTSSISSSTGLTERVKDNSELAKFINFCVNRESPWGVMDANILNALQTDGGIVVNNLPIVNDIIDVVNATEDVANQKWATGENCVNSSDNPRWDSEFKYYQRYVEDMRIIYGMNDPESGDTNPVIAYQESYREAHPIDTSFRGTLSRISGLSMDDVAFLLEYVDYSTQIANYDPSTRIKFGNSEEPTVELSFTEPATPSFNILSIIPDSIFIDRRNYTV